MTHLSTKSLQEFYKTTPMRNGVLSWYPFNNDATVFEQSGGALTEWLKTQLRKVVSNKIDIAYKEKFDYVVIVDPVEITIGFLNECYNMLNPSGKLLLVFENSFGLQYFAGKRNTRTQLPFTFRNGESKKEVDLRLKQVGFVGQKWYYPFPNHYFTKEVYSEKCLPNEFLNHRPSDYLEDDYTKVFDEREIWREVIRNGAFEFMCNSYLVEATTCEEIAACDIDYAAVTIYRERDRAFTTTVHNNGMVQKTALYEEGIERLRTMERIHNYLQSIDIDCVPVKFKDNSLIMPRVNLPTLWDWWTQKLSEGQLTKETLFKNCDYIRDCIYKSSANGLIYWELVPANCFYNEDTGGIIFFDQEFYWENTDPDVALVRALWLLVWSDGSPVFEKTKVWLEELKERYHLTEKWDKLLKIARDETHKYVFNPSATHPIQQSVSRATMRIEGYRKSAETEKNRYIRFVVAAKKLRNYGVNRVVVYGYGTRGKTFVNVLEMEDIEVVSVIDNNITEIKSVSSDAIVVTPLKEATYIASELRKYTEEKIFILEELL